MGGRNCGAGLALGVRLVASVLGSHGNFAAGKCQSLVTSSPTSIDIGGGLDFADGVGLSGLVLAAMARAMRLHCGEARIWFADED